MLPFPNRIRDGRFTFGGEEFRIDPPRHGMVRDKAWTVVETGASDGGAWITSRIAAEDYPDRILAQFPFRFVADVTYGLSGRTLDMVTVVTNAGDREMPFGFGIHPYFRCPARGTLVVPADARWELEESLPTGQLLDVEGAYDLRTPRDVTALEVDDVFTDLEPDTDGLVHCTLADADAGTSTVVAFDAAEFPHVVAYTAPAPRRAICIEPQTCPTDAFNLAARGVTSDMIVLAPGASRRFTIRIRG
jgi:aldose 1-epimerase